MVFVRITGSVVAHLIVINVISYITPTKIAITRSPTTFVRRCLTRAEEADVLRGILKAFVKPVPLVLSLESGSTLGMQPFET